MDPAWSPVITTYHAYHESANPAEPFYMPEFQGETFITNLATCTYITYSTPGIGGMFDVWGGLGYNSCRLLTGPDFEDVFYKHNWASNVKLISYYMFYG